MTSQQEYHPDVKRLLDGELSLGQLSPELLGEAEAALRMMAALTGAAPAFSPWFEQRVMAEVRRRPVPARFGLWAWLNESRPLRIRPRLLLATMAVAAAALILLVQGGRGAGPAATPGLSTAPTYVRFLLYAPNAHSVALAGSFNSWDPSRTPLVPTGSTGFWTATVAVPSGSHQYGFVLDGGEWLPDPGAPAVEDGFGRRNSVLTVTPSEVSAS